MTNTNDSFTVDEARQMRCPLGDTCLASACMAWRWSQAKQTAAYSKAVIDHAVKDTADNPKHSIVDSYRDVLIKQGGKFERTEGYCGIAGFPHSALKP